MLGRVLAGIGAGLVIRSAPRILPAGQEGRVAWAGIVLPAAGPVVIALAVEWSPWWSWQGGFLFEVVLALLSLALVLSIADPPDLDRDSPPGPVEPLGYLPAAVVAALSVWYVMHWGQLHGWLEGPDITAAMIVGSVALSVLLWIVWPGLDPGTLREGLPRLGLITYGGFVQYFNSLDMGVYGGLLVNFSPWMRSWLIWSLTLGSTAALALGRIVWQKRSPDFAGAALGLLVLAGGMSLSHRNTMNWPFWSLLNTVEFNWFAAPQHRELALPRFLMGFGSGMVLLAMTTCTSCEPLREARIRPLLRVAQFAGGTLSVGVLVTVLLAAHQLQYSYVADRGFIQAVERGDRNSRLAAYVATAGAARRRDRPKRWNSGPSTTRPTTSSSRPSTEDSWSPRWCWPSFAASIHCCGTSRRRRLHLPSERSRCLGRGTEARCWNTGLAGASGAHGGGTVQSGRPVSRSAQGPEMCGEMVPGSTCTSKTSSTPVTGLARCRLKGGPPSVLPVAGIAPELPPS